MGNFLVFTRRPLTCRLSPHLSDTNTCGAGLHLSGCSLHTGASTPAFTHPTFGRFLFLFLASDSEPSSTEVMFPRPDPGRFPLPHDRPVGYV